MAVDPAEFPGKKLAPPPAVNIFPSVAASYLLPSAEPANEIPPERKSIIPDMIADAKALVKDGVLDTVTTFVEPTVDIVPALWV